LYGAARLAFTDAKLKLEGAQEVSHLTEITEAAVPVDWADGLALQIASSELTRAAPAAGTYADLPAPAGKAKNYAAWSRLYKTWLAEAQTMTLLRSADGKLVSRPGESEGDFRVRLQQSQHERRDEQLEKLRAKYAARLRTLKDRVRRAEHAVAREREQASEQKVGAAISVGSTLVGALMGRKALSQTTVGRAGTAARSLSRSARQAEDVDRAEESLESVQQQLTDLEAEFAAESDQLKQGADALTAPLEQVQVRPKKTGITVQVVTLVWAPHWQQPDGVLLPAWASG
jgi:F0F1-type ATP synthase assembly protein I